MSGDGHNSRRPRPHTDEAFSSNPPEIAEVLSSRSVFIAGAGGLGSNVAVLLVRAGLGRLTIADFDSVTTANLNRQYYFRDQIGMRKIDALRATLLRINPALEMMAIDVKLSADNLPLHLDANVDVVIECFDDPVAKADLTRHCLREHPKLPLVAASGVAGIGEASDIRVSKGPGRLLVVGDATTDLTPQTGTLSSKVALAAASQAHEAIKIMIHESNSTRE